MNTELKKDLLLHFNNLPQEVQKSFLSLNLDTFLDETQETGPLEIWQRNIIKDYISLVFLGLSDPSLLATNITHSAEISRDRAEKIARSINQKILIPNESVIKLIQEGTDNELAKKDTLKNRSPSTDGIIRNNIPIPVKLTEEGSETKRLENVEQQIKKGQVGTLDVFKKRLTSPVHTPAKEERVSGTSSNAKEKERIANTDPSSPEQIASDPYKESIE